MTRESDIIHDRGSVWVVQSKTQYTVYRFAGTHGRADSSYRLDPDGRSIAIARCDYLAKTT